MTSVLGIILGASTPKSDLEGGVFLKRLSKRLDGLVAPSVGPIKPSGGATCDRPRKGL